MKDNNMIERKGTLSLNSSKINSSGNPPIIVIPEKIFKAIKRNNLNIVDITNYSKVRSFLSLNDLAEMNFLTISGCVSNVRLSNLNDLLDLFTTITNEEALEFNNVIKPLSFSEEVSSYQKNNTGDICYEFIQSNDYLFLVIQDGFLHHVNNELSFRNEFIKAYIKQCYAMVAIHEVSAIPVYKLYIQSV
jgi:hypothetical protein